MPRPPTPDEAALFTRLGQGHVAMRLLLMAGRLGLVRLLADGPRGAADLAAATGSSPAVMPRMLRAMAALGIIEAQADGRFAGTGVLDLIDVLLVPGFDETSYTAWEHAGHSLRTGEPAWDQVFGKSFFDSLDAGQSDAFDLWNTATAASLAPIAAMEFWSDFHHVVDVGGGQGRLLAEILAANPDMEGQLLDRPESLRRSPELLERRGVADRCRLVPGSFFDEVPKGGDAYLLSRVLLNWNDEKCVAILDTIGRAAEAGSTLVVVDLLIPPPDHPAYCFAVVNDLNLLVGFGGGSRSESEWRRLIETGPFRVTGVEMSPPPSMMGVIFAVREAGR